MTITNDLRRTFPEHYARKDARNAIYRAVYGQLYRRTALHPRDQAREHSEYHDWTAAAHIVRANWRLAAFPEPWIIIEDFNRLAGGEAALEGLS